MNKKVDFGDILKLKLDNELTALILPDRRADVASVVHWSKVGYFNETDDVLGISHFLEHLFFKGSKTRKMEDISAQIKSLGGYLNAGTIYDHTYFYSVLPAENISRAMGIIADIILNPNFTDSEIETEKLVVIEEVKRKLDSPDQLGFEKLVEMAFEKHRIRRFRMGYAEDIRRLTREAIEQYYQNFYKPANSIVSIVGNFSSEEVAKSVRELYSGWEKGKVAGEERLAEPPQKFPKYRKLLGDITQSYMKMGFHVPCVMSDDFYPVNFLAAVLGRGRSSRLYRTLKEDSSLVDDVSTSIYADKDIGYFVFESTLKKENFSKAEFKIAGEIKRLIEDPPSDGEMEKVKNIIETSYFSDKEDVLGQAYNLAYFESLGDYKLSKDFLIKSLAVKKEDVAGCARKFLNADNMSLLEYTHGRPKRERKADFRMKDSLAKKFRELLSHKAVHYGDGAGSTKAKTEDFPFSWLGKHESGKPTVKHLGATTLIFKKNTGVPMISAALYLPGGRLDENEQNCGITNLVLRSSLKGTKDMKASEIAKTLESLGCSLRVEATADNFGYGFTVLRKNFEKSYDVIRKILFEPVFDEAEIKKEKSSMKAAILSRRDDMFRYPVDLCYRALFGIHPYGLPRYGTQASLDSVTREDILKWHEDFFDWSGMTACLVGEAADGLHQYFSGPFKKRIQKSRAKVLPLVIKRGIKEASEKRKKKQTSFAIGFKTPGMSGDDYYTLEVLQNLLSGMGGRLYMEVREKKGLAYTVTAFNISLLQTGAFVIYAATSPKNEDETLDIILEEVEKIKRDGITSDEIARAKSYTIGSNSIALQTNLAQVYEYLRYYFVKRDIEEVGSFSEKINAVSRDDIARVLDKYFKINNYALGIVRGD